ncbi:MAG: NAD(P)-binding domain-containing protein [bacterium]|nr:NAD(P)-binding domain-containing protein [bacterium]
MTWTLLACLLVVLMLGLAVAFQRRAELRRQRDVIGERAAMAARQVEATPLQVPLVDLQKCLGCGTCIRACPEEGVLDLVHGQAAVVNPALCVGHARCVAECPVGAVTLGHGDLSERDDVPVLDDELAVPGTDGVYLVGEITAKALIRPATEQGARVAATIGGRPRGHSPDILDLVIVGAGPAGLACALGAIEQGLEFLLIDQEAVIGGTVAKYPRRKLVLTEPITLPLRGRLPAREYAKEDLVSLWQELADRHGVPFRGGITFDRCEPHPDGGFTVHTDGDALRTDNVVLALGRRGQPRRLGVPGEDLPHVAYALLDAHNFQGLDIVVVGGGDSAVEAAMALAEQAGNRVTIVHRQDEFFRIRRRNRDRLQACFADGRISPVYEHEVASIGPGTVAIRPAGDTSGSRTRELAADQVFVMIGGVPPFQNLRQSGVSFDHREVAPAPDDRASTAPESQATSAGLLPVLGSSLVLTIATFAFALWHLDYYEKPAALRAADPTHALLRPDQSLGLWFGIVAVIALLANLAYLLRRRLTVRFGSLTGWMSVHIVTGVAALLLAALHAALAPRSTPGGHAFWALAALVVTGAIGRWFYAWLPRAANGRELELTAVKQRLAELTADDSSEFANRARSETSAMLERRQWRGSFCGRVLTLIGLSWDLWFTNRQLKRIAATEQVPDAERAAVMATVRAAHRTAVAAAHLEDLRAVLSAWRWFHRWLALLLMLLVVVHVVMAWSHGAFGGS